MLPRMVPGSFKSYRLTSALVWSFCPWFLDVSSFSYPAYPAYPPPSGLPGSAHCPVPRVLKFALFLDIAPVRSRTRLASAAVESCCLRFQGHSGALHCPVPACPWRLTPLHPCVALGPWISC